MHRKKGMLALDHTLLMNTNRNLRRQLKRRRKKRARLSNSVRVHVKRVKLDSLTPLLNDVREWNNDVEVLSLCDEIEKIEEKRVELVDRLYSLFEKL